MIETQIKSILAKQFGVLPETILNDSNLIDLGADSLDIVEIVMELETHFKIIIEENEYAEGSTVNSIVHLVESKLTPKV
jgi:acyl carrier protein